jgi:hypothetical protein
VLLETILLAAIIGPLTLQTCIAAAPRLLRHVCDPPRRRKSQLAAAISILC